MVRVAAGSKRGQKVGFHEQLKEMIARDSLDFDAWTSLISEMEKTCPENIEKISLLYESFLSKFPLCQCYWKRYADHKARICTTDKAGEIFERGLQSATHCVGLWVDYFSFSMYAFQDPSDIRRLFQRGMSYVGKDYMCYTLWDKFIKFEYSQENWSSLAHIFIQTLRFPTKKLHSYYDNLKKFAALMEEEMKCESNCSIGAGSDAVPDCIVTRPENEICQVIKDLHDPSNGSLKSKALQKYLLIGEHFYNKACLLDGKIHCFETRIKRPFFDVKPLDDNQLENWHRYLDFIEKQDDFDWAVKFYERCLIPCANYPEFWMRYVEFVENKGGRELANFALERATQIFLKDVTAIHIFSARFKEKIGDADGARAAFLQCDIESNSYVTNVIKEANMEKRLGNLASASAMYEKALKMAAERQKLHIVPVLYIHFSRLQYLISGSADVAVSVITDGIQHMPHCKLLLEELINFAMTHEGSKHVNVVDSIIDHAIAPDPDESQGLSPKDREDLSCLHLEFVDLCGTNHDIRKAWNRHVKLFPRSMRSVSLYNYPISSDQLLSGTEEGRQKNLFAMCSQPSDAHSSDHSIELPAEEQVTDWTRPKDNDNSAHKQMQPRPSPNGAGVSKFTHDLVHQSGDDVEKMKLSWGLVFQPREDVCGSIESAHDLAHKSQKDASQPIESTYEFDHPQGPVRPSEASQGYLNSINTRQEQEKGNELELEKHPEPVSLENLSLDSQGFIPMVTHEHDVPQKIPTCHRGILEGYQNTEENPSTACPTSSSPADSAKLQNQTNEKELTSHKTLSPAQTRPLHQEVPPNSCEMDVQLRVRNGTRGQIQFQANASQGKITTSHGGALENVPHQSSISTSQSQMSSQPAFPYPQVPQMSQYPTQDSDQAYNQMWHYHYQQQQFQQQLMQMQPYFPQQQQQQQQQQQPFRPPPPPQQQHFLQQQLQPSSYQPQQDQQQYLLYLQQQHIQQQQYYQFGEVASQQQQQGYQLQLQQYQQQHEQGYQLWLQQQQGYKQQQQQQQQQMPQQQQNQENQGQHQQAQGIAAPCSTTVPISSESPRAMTHPHTTGAPRPVVSPHHPQQPPGGVSPSLSTCVSIPAPSFQNQ